MIQEKWGTVGERPAVSNLLQRLCETQKQAKDRHLSQQVLKGISEDLGLSMAFVRGVATFYSMLSERPRGRHIIRVCESPQCQLAGGKELVEELQKLLGTAPGETSADGMFTIELSSCLGACDNAPAISIDDALYTNVKQEDLPKILEEARRVDWVGPRQGPSVVLGEPRRLFKDYPPAGEMKEGVPTGSYAGLRHALTELSPDEVLATIKESGLRGRGGAGFPTGRKWEFTRNASGEPKYIVCNADEGEPGTFKDRILLEETPHLIIEGLILAGYAVGATQGYIYIRGEFAESIKRMGEALAEARQEGYLGGNILGKDFSFDIEIHQGAGAYVCGEETSLLESIEGKRGFPRLRPPYPASAGLWGKPTVVNNVETLANVPLIISSGVKDYRSLGTQSSPGTKLYPLSGAVNNPGVVETEMGVTLRDLIFGFGGGMAEGTEFSVALVGGAAGVFLGKEMLDVPLEYDSLAERDAVLGSGAVLVLDKGCRISHLLFDILHFFAHESCGKCVPCRIGTARLVELMERFTEGMGTEKELDLMLKTARVMRETSLCPLGQSCYPMLQSALNYFRDDLLSE